MPRRKQIFAQNQFYHKCNRGVNGMRIFSTRSDYLFVLTHLGILLKKYGHSVIAYCLMPNHYHILLRQDGEIPAGLTVQYLFNRYTKYFNVRTERRGALFEGRYRCHHIKKTESLLHICRYIHRNPIDCNPPLVKELMDWEYSNYPEWIGMRNGNLVNQDFIQTHFCSNRSYRNFLIEHPAQKVLIRQWE